MIRRPHTSDYKHKRVRLKRTVRTLLSPEQMNQAMTRESARVDRKSGGTLTLVLFRVPAEKRTKLSGIRLAKTILKRIRVTDDLGWFDDEHLGLLLPETTPTGAWRLAQHICDVVAKRGARPLCTMYTYGADTQAATVVRSTEPVAREVKIAS
jgi:hypothetical protein